MIPLFVVLLAAAVVAVMLFVWEESQQEITESVYQFTMTEKYKFGPGTKLIIGKNDLEIKDAQSEEAVTSDATPLYYEDSVKMMLTRDISWLDPVSGYERRIPEFSILLKDDNDVIRCDTGKNTVTIPGGFLHDGAGTYLFLDKGILVLNGENIPIEPFSFCSTSYGVVRVFSYGSDDVITKDKGSTNITFSTKQGYELDLTSGIYYGENGGFRLLVASPSVLNSIDG